MAMRALVNKLKLAELSRGFTRRPHAPSFCHASSYCSNGRLRFAKLEADCDESAQAGPQERSPEWLGQPTSRPFHPHNQPLGEFRSGPQRQSSKRTRNLYSACPQGKLSAAGYWPGGPGNAGNA